MPGKVRRKRGKHIQSSKIRSHQHTAPVSPVRVADQPAQSVFRDAVIPPVTTPIRHAAMPMVIQHPYIVRELRTIGILASIMLSLLVILFVVLT